MSQVSQPTEITASSAPAYKGFRHIVQHPELLGGQLTIRGTRIGVSHLLESVAAGLSLDDINDFYESSFTDEVLHEALLAAADLLGAMPATAHRP